jgi:hypothetical protein
MPIIHTQRLQKPLPLGLHQDRLILSKTKTYLALVTTMLMVLYLRLLSQWEERKVPNMRRHQVQVLTTKEMKWLDQGQCSSKWAHPKDKES